MIEGGVVYFIRADHIGRPVFATNASGAKVWSVTYTPFGGVHTSSGLPIEARFPGQWYQAESGLHQNWMRDYDPTTGRYIQADPLGLMDGASVYGYVRGNPGRWIDPRGEFGLLGGFLGGVISFGLQFGTNYLIGGMSLGDSLKCVDLVAVTNAFAIGFTGFSPALLAKGNLKTGAVAVAAVGTHANRVFPDGRIGELMGESCDCSLPPWADRMRDLLL